MGIIEEISANVQKGKAKVVVSLVEQAIDEGVPVQQILDEGLIAAMDVVGELFRKDELYIPEVIIVAKAMNAGVAVLKPLLAEDDVKSKGKACIGTVKGDLHDVGKNLVKMMMECKGLEVIDLGMDVSPDQYIECVMENGCQIVCCSALLTTTMPVMAEVVKATENAGIRNKVKIMVGGAPVTEEFCKSIGADAYAPDAGSAAMKAVELLTL